MPAIFLLALRDLADARILRLLVRSLLVTLLIFGVMGAALWWALAGSDPCEWLGDYYMTCGLSPSWGGFWAMVVTLLALWFLFPAVALGVLCAYIERIMGVIEARHYPLAAAGARGTGVVGALGLGLRSAARVLLYNLVALPLYILLLFTAIGAPIAFVVVNGAAFGRDLGEMVAARHGDRTTRRAWLRRTRGERLLIGSAVTGLFLVPFVNLLAPILGAAMATHLYHRTVRTLR